MVLYPESTVERAMKVQEVNLNLVTQEPTTVWEMHFGKRATARRQSGTPPQPSFTSPRRTGITLRPSGSIPG